MTGDKRLALKRLADSMESKGYLHELIDLALAQMDEDEDTIIALKGANTDLQNRVRDLEADVQHYRDEIDELENEIDTLEGDF